MREKIIEQTMISFKTEGLRFSVDTLAARLKVSKKTIYKYFATKEELAAAVYQSFYDKCEETFNELSAGGERDIRAFLELYYSSSVMVRAENFNKYALNSALKQNALTMHSLFSDKILQKLGLGADGAARLIIDGTFDRLNASTISPEEVIDKLVKMLC